MGRTNIKTRFLIVSNTHGRKFTPETKPLQRADVAIHCGDLTTGSLLEEMRTALQLLKDIDAPLKLVIAGNHDFTLHLPTFQSKVAEVYPPVEPDLVAKTYSDYGELRRLFEDAKDGGVMFLDQRTHPFTLSNLALLTVYPSPYTPSLGDWAFQYHPDQGHDFQIEKGVDVVITHGPREDLWTTPFLNKGLDALIFLVRSLELAHDSIVLGIFMKVGEPS